MQTSGTLTLIRSTMQLQQELHHLRLKLVSGRLEVVPTTAAAGPRLSTSNKGKQPATTSKARSLSAHSKGFPMYPLMSLRKKSLGIPLMKKVMMMIMMKEMMVMMVKKEMMMMIMHKMMMYKMMMIRKMKGMMRMIKRRVVMMSKPIDEEGEDAADDEGDDEEGSDDEQASNKEEFIHLSLSIHDEEETRDEESFDPIPKTHESMDDEGNGEENLEMNVGREEGQDEEDEEDELYRDVNINLGRGIQMGD
nr:hypothetical protein [Tanacetum cinerariifolium]